MKTLNESINEVMNSNKAVSTKRNELKKLCLSPSDIQHIIFKYKVEHPEAFVLRVRTERFAYRFGVEVECLCNRLNVERALNANEVPYMWSGRYYHSNGNQRFEFKSDCSICSDSHTACDNSGIEMVSPVLSQRGGFDLLKKACDALEDNGAQVNKSTGLHVHLSTKDMSNEHFVNVFKNYQKLERVIDSFMPNSRRGNNNHYCASIQGYDFSRCSTPRDVQSVMGNCRYFKCNPMAWDSHKTIEFRQHSGSTNYTKIEHWVKFCAALVGWSKKHVLDHEVASVDEIPFLNDEQKAFFNGRVAHLNGNAIAA